MPHGAVGSGSRVCCRQHWVGVGSLRSVCHRAVGTVGTVGSRAVAVVRRGVAQGVVGGCTRYSERTQDMEGAVVVVGGDTEDLGTSDVGNEGAEEVLEEAGIASGDADYRVLGLAERSLPVLMLLVSVVAVSGC